MSRSGAISQKEVVLETSTPRALCLTRRRALTRPTIRVYTLLSSPDRESQFVSRGMIPKKINGTAPLLLNLGLGVARTDREKVAINWQGDLTTLPAKGTNDKDHKNCDMEVPIVEVGALADTCRVNPSMSFTTGV